MGGAPTRLQLQTGRKPGPPAPATPARAMILFILALLVVNLPSRGAAQQQLVGIVMDRETSAPLTGVYVALEARAGRRVVAALTDESGRFVLTAEVGGTYRLRAERVGLATETTDWFRFEEGAPPRSISMAERAVELEGLSVRGRVRTCRLEPVEATVVQRWWDEVRKALESTALVEAGDLARLRFERFEREWSANLRAVRRERVLPADSTPSRPFLSPDAETLSKRGFVQGQEGDRLFLAPDAAVLFSRTFLEDHCLGIAVEGEEEVDGTESSLGELRLTVEPTRKSPPDIRGVLTVDTLTSELRAFDFKYVNLPPDLPRNRSGGHLTFAQLPSGVWVVSDWWIRLPRIQYQSGEGSRRGAVPVVMSYVDQGGRAVEAGGRPLDLDARLGRATIHGTVYDSLTGGPLARARVSIVGSRLAAWTGLDGRFILADVPAGLHGLTFHHAELTRMGLPSPVYPVEAAAGSEDTVALATPGFATTAMLLCADSAGPPETILTGRVIEALGAEGVPSAEIRARWVEAGASGVERSMRREGRAGSDGRYLLCDLPTGVPIALAVRTDSVTWRDAGAVELPRRQVVVDVLRPGQESRAIVRGTVRAEEGDSLLAGANVWVLAVTGDTVAGALTDSVGAFRVDVPPDVGYRAIAVVPDEYLREASAAFTLDGAESLDVQFELIRDPKVLAMKIEGLVVEIEARKRKVAKRLLMLYGQSPARLGRRWIDRATLDALPSSGESDPGVAIEWQGMPRVSVDQAVKHGKNPILCVRQGPRRCAIVVLNGARINLRSALLIDFRDLEAIAVLSPQDATTFYGTEAGGGAVLLWTRLGGR
jgi:Carboxypeptidase regulatory-like domain